MYEEKSNIWKSMDINQIKKDLGILSAIGNVPVVKLSRLSANYHFNIYAKLELLNPGGSIKDRVALHIILSGIERGLIKPDTMIVECTSGNLGIGLAQVCCYLGLPFTCVVDTRVTENNINILKTYGANIIFVSEPDIETGEFLPVLIRKVKELLSINANSFWPNQHANLDNAAAHHATMAEIIAGMNGKVDYLFCATSSCGTLRGCHDYISTHNLKIKIYAVDAEGSKIFSKISKKRLIPGHGAGIVPDLYHDQIQCVPIVVSASESILGCKKLIAKEAILAGGSSGGIISAIDKVQHEIKEGANCVVILCDRGERYINTIFSNQWVNNNSHYL